MFLAKQAIKSDNDYSLSTFAWVFLLLCWNLIARCNSVASIMYDHLSWNQDHLNIVFPSHKGDKEGKTSIPKAVYANPQCPEICAILALAIYFFSSCWRRVGSKRTLFSTGSSDTENRFSRWLKSVCTDEQAELINMGLLILAIGTHSFRKGVATFLSAINGGPTAVAIYLRAGWSLGPVQSRYILEGKGSDELCGRAATCINITDSEFAALPPHFNLCNGPIMSQAEWEAIVPG